MEPNDNMDTCDNKQNMDASEHVSRLEILTPLAKKLNCLDKREIAEICIEITGFNIEGHR